MPLVALPILIPVSPVTPTYGPSTTPVLADVEQHDRDNRLARQVKDGIPRSAAGGGARPTQGQLWPLSSG